MPPKPWITIDPPIEQPEKIAEKKSTPTRSSRSRQPTPVPAENPYFTVLEEVPELHSKVVTDKSKAHKLLEAFIATNRKVATITREQSRTLGYRNLEGCYGGIAQLLGQYGQLSSERRYVSYHYNRIKTAIVLQNSRGT